MADVFVLDGRVQCVPAHLDEVQLHCMLVARLGAAGRVCVSLALPAVVEVHHLHEHLGSLRHDVLLLEVVLLLERLQQRCLAHLGLAQHTHVSAQQDGCGHGGAV